MPASVSCAWNPERNLPSAKGALSYQPGAAPQAGMNLAFGPQTAPRNLSAMRYLIGIPRQRKHSTFNIQLRTSKGLQFARWLKVGRCMFLRFTERPGFRNWIHNPTMNQRQSDTISWPKRGNHFSLSPGERAGVRASSFHTNFFLRFMGSRLLLTDLLTALMSRKIGAPASGTARRRPLPTSRAGRPALRFMGRAKQLPPSAI